MLLPCGDLCSRWAPLSLLLVLVTGKGANQGASSPLDTLQCYNNYRTQTTCTWKETVDARRFLKLRLYHWQNYGIADNVTCNAPGLGVKDGSHVTLTCIERFNGQAHFGLHLIDHYAFIPDQELDVRRNISPWESIRPLPPQNLKVGLSSTSSDFLLSWQTLYDGMTGRLTSQDLEHEVQHKRDWEHWEDASSRLVPSGSSCTIASWQVVPGNTYVARIRSRPRAGASISGTWSEWSALLSWKVPEGVAAAPKNLKCSFDGISRMSCSWEVRAEVTQSVSFVLYYQEISKIETACHPVQLKSEHQVSIHFYSCEFTLSNPEELGRLHISIRPEEKSKSFKQCLNIQPFPPSNFTAGSENDQEYVLTWKPWKLEYDHIAQRYQLCYRKLRDDEEGEDFNQFSLECPPGWKALNISNGPPSVTFNLKTQLDPLSRFTARVRASVASDSSTDCKTCYCGPWSEWSEAISWETGAVWDPQMLYVVLTLVGIGLLAGVVFCCHCLKRSKRRWEDKIPSPSKSQLLASFLEKGSLAFQSTISGPGGPWIFPAEITDPSDCSLVIEGKCKDASDLPPVSWNFETLCPTSQQFGPGTRLHSAPGQHSGYQAFPEGGDCKSPRGVPFKDQGNACSDLNGPYLFLPHTSCQSDNLIMDPLAEKEGYVSLPQDWNPQTLTAPDNAHPASSHFGYVMCPPAVSDSAEPQTQEGECSKYQPLVNQEVQQEHVSLDMLTTLLDQVALFEVKEALPTSNPVDYVLAPPNILQMTKDKPSPPNSNGLQAMPTTKPDNSEVMITTFSKQAESLESGYVIAPTAARGTIPAPTLLPSFPKETDSPNLDKLLIFSPDGASPVLMHQVGDYCFFPRPNSLESTVQDADFPSGGSALKPALTLPPDDSPPKEPAPHFEAIQMFKFIRNDYVAFP
ncbi:cytokine receptor common subunit beta [Ambystoma mexicanum]|uniref:cytokine receptor common subunit beta n=1 Tax=Ambystoma mexicanum TaxID=8296 RepID=UPI0037E8CF45